MKAVRFESVGTPESVLKTVEIQMPQPQHGEVLVRMLAAPVNPSDLMFVRGRYTIPPQCPATPGFEGVGVVEKSGGGLKGTLFRGKRVVVLSRTGGSWAQHVIVPSSQVVPVSSALSVEQAATFFVNPATAWIMTCEVLKVPRGQWLVQTAAGSALGRMIVRLGNERGFRTLNIVRRESVADELRRLGAQHVEVFDENATSHGGADGLVERIRSVTGPSGARYAIDAVGGLTGSAVVRSLGHQGRMLAFGTLSGQPLEFSPRTLMTAGSSVEGFWLGNFMNTRSLIFKLRLIRRLTRLIQSGVLSSEISASFSLDQITAAVKSAEDSSHSGKTLLTMT